jgi:hypothetical protein
VGGATGHTCRNVHGGVDGGEAVGERQRVCDTCSGVAQPSATQPPQIGTKVLKAEQTGGDTSTTSLGVMAMVLRAASESSSSTASAEGIPVERSHPS